VQKERAPVGERELLHGALENVVRNAIRFAPEGTDIEVHLSKPDVGLARIVIADRGSGVPESQIAMLFDPFAGTRLENNALSS